MSRTAIPLEAEPPNSTVQCHQFVSAPLWEAAHVFCSSGQETAASDRLTTDRLTLLNYTSHGPVLASITSERGQPVDRRWPTSSAGLKTKKPR